MGFALVGSIVVLTLLFRPNFSQQQEQPIPNTDEFFISDFFRKMGSNYSVSGPVCSWNVVVCDANQENVISLIASNLGLSGSIPDNTIGKLTKIQTLDLSSNHITDLPSDFWSLGSLLNLSNNKVSMNVPSNIGNFGSLEKLDLSFNSLPFVDFCLTFLGITLVGFFLLVLGHHFLSLKA